MAMTDDEAFIRALLAAPADEAPRLVYADWLDERGDPRGTYLRLELRTPGDPYLRDVASDLDPVWLARVSRPPAGLCSDRVTFTEAAPPVTLDEIEAAEDRLGFDLPGEYIAFLLTTNGGVPDPCHVLAPGWDPEDYAEVDRFFSLYPPGRPPAKDWTHDLEADATTLKDFEENAIGDYLPIAAAGESSYLLLGVAGDAWGKVAHFADYTHNAEDPDRPYPVADSFARFLAGLTNLDPPWVRLVHSQDAAGFLAWLEAGGDVNEVSNRYGSVLEVTMDEGQWDLTAELLRRGVAVPGSVRKRLERHAPPSIRQMVRDRTRE
jgi:uncharacterized protein (TIGR02996 family)